jgi:tetratricopeptide (TPR) repeat protein
MIFRFGREEEKEEFTWKDLIELAEKDVKEEIKEGEPGEEGITPQEIARAQEFINSAKADFASGLFDQAVSKLEEADKILKDDKEVKGLLAKGRAFVNITGQIKGRGRMARLVRSAAEAYIDGNGKSSLDYIRYAKQKYQNSRLVSGMLELIEREFPDAVRKEKLVVGINLVNQKLQETLELIYDGKYVAAITLCEEALKLEPRSVLALMRMGSAYWAMGMPQRAKEKWKQALKIDPDNKQLMEFLKMEIKGVTPRVREAQKLIPKQTDAKTVSEYHNAMAYYNRVKRYGANKETLRSKGTEKAST